MEIVEKLNDLSSRMRSDASNDECTPDGIMGQTLNSYADEVDGLVKVAIEELRRGMVGRERECGNYAASREALTKILNLTNSLDEDCAVDPVEIRDIAKAALAEPAKNCEVGTVEEQAKRLNEWCNGRHCINCRFKGGLAR